jgi:NADP-dependent 3-hydroxy acid dehydrogenase YdfG
MQLCHALLPLLAAHRSAHRQRRLGVRRIGYPGYAVYCASKFALRGFSEALRRELADGPVRVLHLAPRATRTAINPRRWTR